MEVKITLNKKKQGIELLFSKDLPIGFVSQLSRVGFKPVFNDPLKWIVKTPLTTKNPEFHKAYVVFANELQEALKEENFSEIQIRPSFEVSETNIKENKFSYVEIYFKRVNGDIISEDYVVFDSYRNVAYDIALKYGQKKYGESFEEIKVHPRNYKTKAKKLLKEGKVIPSLGIKNEDIPKRVLNLPLEPSIEKESPASEKNLSNEYGVYTEESAGENYEEIEIPIPKGSKHEARIKLVKDEDNLYRVARSIVIETNGKHSGLSKKVSLQYKTREESLSYIINEIYHSFRFPYDETDYSDYPKTKSALKALTKFAIDNDLSPDFLKLKGNITPPLEKDKKKRGELPLKELVKEAIDKLSHLVINLNGLDETIIETTRLDLEEVLKQEASTELFQVKLHEAVQSFMDWEMDIKDQEVWKQSILVMNPLVFAIGKETIEEAKKEIPQVSLEERIEGIEKELDEVKSYLVASGILDKEGKENSAFLKALYYTGKESYFNAIEGLDKQAKLLKELQKLNQEHYQLQHPKPESKQGSKEPSIAKDITRYGVSSPNVLVPKDSKEPFISGGVYIQEAEKIHQASPNLIKLKDTDLPKATVIELFELSQLPHPKEYGLHVNRSTLLKEWEKRGRNLFKELGFPTELEYPYVNVNAGYGSVYPLSRSLNEQEKDWWSVVAHSRPMADLQKGLEIIEELSQELMEQQSKFVNPKTSKPIAKKKEEYRTFQWKLENLSASKEVIENYLQKLETESENVEEAALNIEEELPKEENRAEQNKSIEEPDYLDQVIANLQEQYLNNKRPTKGFIQKLAKELKVPNMGMMWEAAELSWLLWYKQIYHEPVSFEARLTKMVQFWEHLQPTYAYSDSSKEIYKQYSTPCPIGAIIAEYTKMDVAQKIFEPSAGNGLLLVGAKPEKVHANEIDATRLKSLKFQEFQEISALNAAIPFPDEMTKKYDVVVTNPPFARWDDTKFDKKLIVQKYFNNQLGVAQHIRLEHLMTGLALHTMKDTGKAGIIIMGHIYFGEDGLIAKYRPFFNWLFRHYNVEGVINMNSFKLYNKQGTAVETMLILINGRKATPKGVAPNQDNAGHFYPMVNSFSELWGRVKSHLGYSLDIIIQQLKIELAT